MAGFQDFLRNNSPALMQAGAGLLGGQTGSQQAAQGFMGFAQGRQQAQAKNKSLEFLSREAPDLIPYVQGGMAIEAALTEAYKRKQEAARPQNPWISTGGGLYNKDTGEWNMPPAKAGGNEYGLTPQTGVDAQGNPVLIQLGKGGVATQSQLPEGITLSKEPIKLDAGTHYVLLDPITRQPVGQIPKDLAGAEAQRAIGKGQGEAQASYESINAKMPGIKNVVKQLDVLAKKATYTAGGQMLDIGMKQLGMEPRESAVARAQYIAIVDNQVLPLLRDTFGAAFTQKEGDTLRATLGDPDKSPAEKQAVLKAFIEQKRRDVQSLAVQAGGTATSGPQRYRYNPQTGELE